MPKKQPAKKKTRVIACKHLQSLNQISNSKLPLCYCQARDFNLSPYNVVCQICEMYKENAQEFTHVDLYRADEAADFQYDEDRIEDFSVDSDVEESEDVEGEEGDEFEADEFEEEEEEREVFHKKRPKHVPVEEEADEGEAEPEEEPEEDEEEIKEEPEEIEGPLIVPPDEEEVEGEEELDYEDEREEGLGKKHGILTEDEEAEEDEEIEEEINEEIDEEIDEELPEEEAIEDEEGSGDSEVNSPGIDSAFDFDAEVIAKIKKSGDKEICPYCMKSKASVLRHLSKCKRAPANVIAAYEVYRKSKKGGKVDDDEADED